MILRLDEIARVVHPERPGDFLRDVLVEVLIREYLHEVAEHVGRHAVVPLRAGRKLQRDLREIVDHSGERRARCAAADLRRAVHRIDRVCAEESVRQPRRVRQQILDGHRPRGRGRLIRLRIAAREHFQIAPLRDVLRDRVVQLERAFFVQHHQRDAGDRLAHRIDAENRVARDRRRAFDVAFAVGEEMRLFAVARNQAQIAGQLAAVDVTFDERLDVAEFFVREAECHGASVAIERFMPRAARRAPNSRMPTNTTSMTNGTSVVGNMPSIAKPNVRPTATAPITAADAYSHCVAPARSPEQRKRADREKRTAQIAADRRQTRDTERRDGEFGRDPFGQEEKPERKREKKQRDQSDQNTSDERHVVDPR